MAKSCSCSTSSCKEEFCFIVEQEECDLLEALNYDLESHKSLLDFMINGGTVDVTSDTFQAYHNKYKELFVEFDVAKGALAEKYFGEMKDRVNWNLDYSTLKLTGTQVK